MGNYYKTNRSLVNRLQEKSGIGIWELKIGSEELWWSDQSYRIFGLQPQNEQMSLEKVLEFVLQEDRNILQEYIRKLLSLEITEYQIEYRIVLKDGELKTIKEEAIIEYNDQNKPEHFAGIIQDISEKKKVTLDLKESNDRFKALSTATFEAIFISEKGFCVEANEAACKMFGYTYDELIGEFGTELMADESKDLVKKNLSEGYEQTYDAIAQRKDGSKFDVEINDRMFDYGGRKLRLTTIRGISERKKAEQKLQESKAYFKALIENISDVITVIDAQGKSLYRSPAYERILGFNVEESIGDRVFDHIYPEDSLRLKAILKNSMDHPEELVPVHFRTHHKDGSLRYFEGTGINLLSIPAVRGVVVNYRDVTERVKAEQLLKANKEKYRIVADYNYDWEYWLGADGSFKYVSPSCYRISGYEPKDFYDHKNLLNDIIIPEDQQVFINHNHGLGVDGYTIPIEFRIKTRENQIRWIEHVCVEIFGENGEPLGVRGSNRDITHNKNTELKIAQTEHKFQAIFNNNPNPTHLVNTNFEIELTNETLLKLKNLKQEEILGRKCYSTYQNSGEICKNCGVRKVFEDGKQVRSENKLLLADGQVKYFETYAYPIFNEEKEITHAVETTIDVTDRKKIQQALELSEHKLKESLQTKNKFLSIIAHDLRSPFQSILGFSNLLTENFDDFSEKEQKKFIGIIHLGISSTYGLLENLLLWSHAQKGSIRFQPESLNLFLLVHEIKDILNQSFLKKGIVFKVKIDEDIYAKADRDMLSTIIRNLLSNAIKFTPKKGAIEISAKVITESEKQTYTEVTINDNGVGIPDDVQKKLFSIDENTSTKGTENESGTGLGLILCKEFVSRHGGDIHIESEEGVGSSFVFTIPSNLE